VRQGNIRIIIYHSLVPAVVKLRIHMRRSPEKANRLIDEMNSQIVEDTTQIFYTC